MKLRSIRVVRMPGIDRPFALEGFTDGLNVVVGPNASGKTSVCRAVIALLWPGTASGEPLMLESVWSDGEDTLCARRELGKVDWWRGTTLASPPEVVDERLVPCFRLGMRDLLDPAGESDAVVARRIVRLISGGYDVRAVLDEAFDPKARVGRHEAGKLDEARAEVRRVRAAHVELDRRRRSLDELDRRLEQVNAEREEAGPLRAALEVAGARTRLAQAEGRRGAFPSGMDRLHGVEIETLDRLEADLAANASERDACRGRLAEAERALAGAGPAESLPDEATLDSMAGRIRDLRDRDRDLERKRIELAEAEAAVRDLGRSLDPEGAPERTVRTDTAAAEAIDRFVRRAAALAQQRAEIESRLGFLGTVTDGGAGRRDLERAAESLRGWLGAGAGAMGPGWFRWGLAVVLVAAFAIPGPADLPWSGFVSAAAGGALAVLIASWAVVLPARRRRWRLRFAEAVDIAPPSVWRDETVRARLRELDDAVASAATAEHERTRAEEMRVKSERLAADEAELEAERGRLREELGVDPGHADLDLALIARRLGAYERAREARVRAAKGVAELERQVADDLASIRDLLVRGGEPAPASSADAEAALGRLERRARALRAAAETRARETDDLERFDRKHAELEQRLRALWEGAGLARDERAELERRVEQLGAWRELLHEVEQCRRELAAASSRLGDREDLLALSEGELERRVAGTERLRDVRDELIQKSTRIREQIDAATGGNAMETALAREDEWRRALGDRRERLLEQTAGAFLLRHVADEHDRDSRPEVLREAERLFGSFTRHTFRMRVVDGDRGPVFLGIDQQAERDRSLSELSDGTRLQLLLAARLAFAGHVDPHARLPLMLDEALTTSDPERFDAIAASLRILARETGRQVFYFTSDPADAERLRRLDHDGTGETVRVIDLGEARALAAGRASASALAVPPRVDPPSPDGMAAAEYGTAIGAPPLEPRRPAGTVHLVYLLRDDLCLLHELLRAGIERLGQWRALAASGEAARRFGVDAAARVDMLGDLATAFCEAWRIGRGRPLDCEALRSARGVTESYLPRMASLVADLEGDAARLVAELDRPGSRRDERLKGYRQDQREDLRNWLVEEGYLDETPVLDESAVRERVLLAARTHLSDGRVAPEEIARLVRGWYASARS